MIKITVKIILKLMNKETKLITGIIITFIFSIQLVVDKSFQPIFPSNNKENNNNKYFGNLKIIEKTADRKEVKDEIKLIEEEQFPIKPSEPNINKNDDKITIKNEIKEKNTDSKIINSNMNKNQSKELKNS
jgi:bisphosphoglycerate-dependent phosphoglycerate mutase